MEGQLIQDYISVRSISQHDFFELYFTFGWPITKLKLTHTALFLTWNFEHAQKSLNVDHPRLDIHQHSQEG